MQGKPNLNRELRDLDFAPRKTAADISADAFYKVASTAGDVGIIVQTMRGIVLWSNKAYLDIMALPAERIIGHNPLSYALPPDQAVSTEEIDGFHHKPRPDGRPQVSIFENVRGTGERFWIELHTSFDHLAGYGDVAINVARDISDHILRQRELSATSVKLSHLAATDSLTGLANRLHILDKIKLALAGPNTNYRMIGLLEIDLDHFKSINDTLGHSAGDAILCNLADTLRANIGPNDVAARVGGDEFLVLCPEIQSLHELECLGQNILRQNKTAMMVDGMKLRCEMSIGAAVATPMGTAPEELLKRADFALYAAKERGRGCVAAYDSTLHDRHAEQALLAEELSDAVRNKQLTYHFQPTFSLKTGTTSGLETLVRWENPRLGWISPADFLPLGKSLGLMAEIDLGAVEAALNLKQELNHAGHEAIRLGFNGSAELLGHPNFFGKLMGMLKERDLSPQSFVIEVLETVVFDDVSKANPLVQTVQRLHDTGVTTLLDDFGTGHAGLTHLATLAVSGVKIDRSLTRNILTDPTCAKIISMMYELCRDLDLYAVTEGIETVEQAQAAYDLGCQVIQGYWISKAMPAEDVIGWLDSRPNMISQIKRSAIADDPTDSY